MGAGCVFCDRSNFEERIIAEGRNWYVIASLGQITDGGYVLIVPKQHMRCMGELPRCFGSVVPGSIYHAEFLAYFALLLEYRKLALLFGHQKKESYPITAFEHGIVGQTITHAHLHILPVDLDFTTKVRADFPESEVAEIYTGQSIQGLYRERPEPYLYWYSSNGKTMVCWNPPAPPQYFRIAAAELLGRPERANWRNVDPELDRNLCQDTVGRLKKYFLPQ